MLIGIHGPLNGGKDTVANIIQLHKPQRFNRYAFAKPLKDALKVMLGFSDQQIEDRTLKEQVDPYWGFAPRKAMQLLGTEFGREMLRKDIWIKRAELEVTKNAEAGKHTIITDVRFENEAEWLRSRDDAVLIYIVAPDVVKDERHLHASEAGISRTDTDIVLVNDKAKGLDVLIEQVKVIVDKLLPV
jgi:hypothetical protein